MRKTRGVAHHPWTGRPGHGQRARPVLRVATDLPWCEKPRGVRGASSHLGLPPDRWRHRVPAPHPTRGAGAPQRGQAVTPAMAAGLTAHGWTMEEVRSDRGPPDLRDRLAQPPTEDTASPFHTRYRGTPPDSLDTPRSTANAAGTPLSSASSTKAMPSLYITPFPSRWETMAVEDRVILLT
jgi:hypothetical protein